MFSSNACVYNPFNCSTIGLTQLEFTFLDFNFTTCIKNNEKHRNTHVLRFGLQPIQLTLAASEIYDAIARNDTISVQVHSRRH